MQTFVKPCQNSDALRAVIYFASIQSDNEDANARELSNLKVLVKLLFNNQLHV